jgi:osmoprotectant transport system substrate-binding protein
VAGRGASRRSAALGAIALWIATLALAGCGSAEHTPVNSPTQTATTTTTPTLPGTGKPPVAVGDKNTFPEQFVLGALYEEALSAQGYTVSLNRNIGPTQETLQALNSGSLDIYPEYIDVWDTSVAGYKRQFASARAAYDAGQRYALAHGLELLRPTPFSDTDGIGVTLTYAVEHGLSSIGDLRKVATTLEIGGPPQFEDGQAGLEGVEERYGFAPASFKSVAVGEQYQALDSGAIQAADVDTTDGQLLSDGYAVLRDPLHVFGWGNAVPVVSQKVLAEEGPAFVSTVNAVSALLTTPVMRRLNALVGLDHENPTTVAKMFLEAHHLIPAS